MFKVEIKIDNMIKEKVQNASVCCIEASIKVEESSEELIEYIKAECEKIEKEMTTEDIASNDVIKANRTAYKACGKNPSRYRTSSEALLRRIVQGKGIYFVNNIVDINNVVSMKSGFSIGSYNTDKIHGDIVLTVGKEGECYQGIGKGDINIENMPVLMDDDGKFGSPTSDSKRALIDDDAENIIMCIYSFSGTEGLKEASDEACNLLEKYASAKNIKVGIYE
ncbi:hypothetical protein EXD82_06945 [Peptacetobacter hominis]|uniref:B3/B4 tRNA-binding domain-containing protein n=1 Tax=Peptacetobacter hominis TaxID=2743610 RepID=A0A544QUK2_9FIRM|nr:hypothetical protein EXD82_06945 [Peptacetobacter hominis]